MLDNVEYFLITREDTSFNFHFYKCDAIAYKMGCTFEVITILPFSIVEELSIIHPIFLYLGQRFNLVFRLENSLIMYFIKITKTCAVEIVGKHGFFLFQNHFLELSIWLDHEGLIPGLLPRVGIEHFAC
ncbi:hypothetical protein ACJX0J_008820, partial [Zea mays]